MEPRTPPEDPQDRSVEAGYGEKSPFRAAKKEPLLTRTMPVAADLPGYRAPSARRDLIAGVTVAALALPATMAYAEVAGVSPVNGLYAVPFRGIPFIVKGQN